MSNNPHRTMTDVVAPETPLINRDEDELGEFVETIAPRASTSYLRDGLIIAGCTLMALYCSIVYGLSQGISSALTVDMNVTATDTKLLVGLSQIGLQFTLPAGLLLDRVGPVITTLVGGIIAVASFLGMSFVRRGAFWAIIVLFMLTSLGEGCAFLAAFKTGIELSSSGSGIGLGLISAGMSLSLFIALQSIDIFEHVSQCEMITDATCWRGSVRVWAVGSAIAMLIGGLSLLLFKRKNYAHLNPTGDVPTVKAVGFFEGLTIWSHPYFLVLFVTYFTSIGCSVFIISNAGDLWKEYTGGDLNYAPWVATILSVFSFGNAGSNFVTGIVLDLWQRKLGFHSRRFWNVLLFLISGPYIVMAVLATWVPSSHGTNILMAICFATCGFAFGGFLVTGGVVMGNIYGFENLGVYYSYMQIGGSLAAVINPLILVAVTPANSFAMYWGIVALLLLCAFAMLFVPLTEFDSGTACRRRRVKNV